MELPYNLLLDNLRESHSVLCFGPKPENTFLRPTFFRDGIPLEENRIYVVSPDHLPPRDQLTPRTMLLCAERLPSLTYQHCGCPLCVISGADIRIVFSEVLAIFDKYNTWEKELERAMNAGADLQELLEITAPLLMNDLTIVDENLRVVAAVNFYQDHRENPEIIQRTQDEIISIINIGKYRKNMRHNQKKRTPFLDGSGCYCINIFIDDIYRGNLSLNPVVHELRNSDTFIMDTLTVCVLEAIKRHNDITKWEADQFELLIDKLFRGEYVESEKLASYTATTEQYPEGRYLCIHFRYISPEETNNISDDSLRRVLIKEFPYIAILCIQAGYAAVVDLAGGKTDYDIFVQQLFEVLNKLGLYAGASNRFNNLTELRFYDKQAAIALQLAKYDKNAPLSHFRDCALRYLLINSPGSFPAEYLCPQSLLDIRTYDMESNVDYWGTLRCYLDEQMNYARTARKLNIHRNTLIMRIERLKSILAIDWDDPMSRLWLRISIWLIDEETKGGD